MSKRPAVPYPQRKVRDRSIALLIAGATLVLPPVGIIALVDGKIAGIPVAVVYIFTVWALLIVGAMRLARPLQETEDGAPPPEPPGRPD